MELRSKKGFEEDFIGQLQSRYDVYDEAEMRKVGKYGSKPDIIAVKDEEALIIETKSESESVWNGCLTWNGGSPDHPLSEFDREWRKYCNSLPDKEAAVWMVHINLQALYYPEFYEKAGGWEMRTEEDNKKLVERIPALAFPTDYLDSVVRALKLMKIDSGFVISALEKNQCLLVFESGQKMIRL